LQGGGCRFEPGRLHFRYHVIFQPRFSSQTKEPVYVAERSISVCDRLRRRPSGRGQLQRGANRPRPARHCSRNRHGSATAPAQTVAFDKYEGYFVSNQFEPNAPRSLVVCKDQAAFDKVFGVGMVMGDRSHRLAAGTFEKSLVVAPIKRGPLTNFSDVSMSLQDGVLTVRYTAKQDPPGSATYNNALILSTPKAGIKSVVFVENGAKVGEKAVD
jgi:hypothetical protein